jgi:hypothetical protein
LIARAEQWMRAHGLQRPLVRSQVSREPAHRFYLAQAMLA